MKTKSFLKPLKHPLVLSLIGILVLTVCVQGAFLIKFVNGGLDTDKFAQKVTQIVDDKVTEINQTIESKAIGSASELTKLPHQEVTGFSNNNKKNLFFNEWNWEDWQPFTELSKLREKTDALFQESMDQVRSMPGFDESWFDTTPSFMSDTILDEDDLAYHVTMSIPGILEDNFDVSIENRTVTVQGKREVFNEKDKGTGKFLMRSQSQSSFRKSYTLPGTTPLENFQTEYENGLLKITIFKGPTNK